MASRDESIELLNQTHAFPTTVLVKVIGLNQQEFVVRVVTVLCEELNMTVPPPYSTRETPNGKHIALSLEPHLSNAEQVLDLYARLRRIEGVVMLL